MRQYDFIIAGGGAAGLSLACHLLQSPLRDRAILIVDKEAKDQNDRTWAFWTDRATPFDAIVHRSWSQLRILDEGFEQTISLDAYRYKVIRGIDFYRFARQSLASCPNVEFLQGHVDQIVDGDQQASIVVGGQRYVSRWIFDSLFDWSLFKPDPARYRSLRQQFLGFDIETPERAFNPDVPILLDFRAPQSKGGELRFFYLLPFSQRQALVESVVCTAAPVEWEICSQAVRAYVGDILGIKEYRVSRMERGITPLTDQPFQRRTGKHVMTIGTWGGRIKPSTGYAFTRIQRDSAAIVRSLLQTGQTFSIAPSPRRYRFFDSVLLQILDDHSAMIGPILTALFKENSGDRVFRFLDEVASQWINLLMIPSLPPALLWQSLLRVGTLGRV
jgi:lycopene beta-cyclase